MVSLRLTSLLALTTFALAFAAPTSDKTFERRVLGPFDVLSNGAPLSLEKTCLAQVHALDHPYKFFRDPFNFSDECTASAISLESDPDKFLLVMYKLTDEGDRGKLPRSATVPRLTKDMYKRISKGNDVATQQNFIDFYYGLLAKTGGPYPTNSNYTKGIWGVLSAWTGFCDSRAIPYDNLADWFQYFATSKYRPTC